MGMNICVGLLFISQNTKSHFSCYLTAHFPPGNWLCLHGASTPAISNHPLLHLALTPTGMLKNGDREASMSELKSKVRTYFCRRYYVILWQLWAFIYSLVLGPSFLLQRTVSKLFFSANKVFTVRAAESFFRARDKIIWNAPLSIYSLQCNGDTILCPLSLWDVTPLSSPLPTSLAVYFL